MSRPQALGPFLREVEARYAGARFLGSDPLQLVHRYPDAADQEIVGFLAAGLAYGRVAQILAACEAVLAVLGPRPATAVRSFDPVAGAAALEGWVYRFQRGRDVAALLWGLRQVLERHGSLGAFFAEGYDPARHRDTRPALSSFCQRFLALDLRPVLPSPTPPGARVRWFFADPADGSACKRLHLYLRWMVRRDALDLGLWPHVRPAHLLMPVDTHVHRVARFVGLTRRPTADGAAAVEITRALRRVDRDDPVRFDWALSRLGILGDCPGVRTPGICEACALAPRCRAR